MGRLISFLLLGTVSAFASAATCLFAVPGSLSGAIVIQMDTVKREYLCGEPVVFRVTIDASRLSSEEIKIARSRSGEKLLVERVGTTAFPPIPTQLSSAHRSRDTSGTTIQQFLLVQPVAFRLQSPARERPGWGGEFLSPGVYTARLEQEVGVAPNLQSLASNPVTFTVLPPTGRSLEAWNALTSTPEIIGSSLVSGFPPRSLENDAVLEKAIRYAGQYIDTPYGQVVLVQSALYAFLHDNFEPLTEAYPTLGRLMDAQPDGDFVVPYAQFLYLALENLLEEGFDPARGLATMHEFEGSLIRPPLLLRREVRRLSSTYDDMIVRGEAPPRVRIEPLVERLRKRGELPTDPQVRRRRHAIALGRGVQ